MGAPNDEKVSQIMSMKADCPDNICIQSFDKAYFDSLASDELKTRFLKCLDSGRENADSGMGCYANQPDDYEEFKPFFEAVLQAYHKVDLSKTKHVNNWSLDGVEGLPDDGVLDLSKLGLPALSMRVRTGRNLKKFPLPGSMSKEQRLEMELAMGQVFDQLIANSEFGGRYVSITPGHKDYVDDAEYNELVKAHIMFKDMAADPYLNSAGISSDWPFGRGCYISEDKGFIIWVGEEDHLRIMCMQKGVILNKVFDRLKAAIDVVEKLIEGGCAYSPDYGVVTSCPTNIGTGMRASVHIPLPNLTSDGTDKQAKAICKPLGLSVRGTGGEHTPIGADGTVDISPSARFCISEAEIVTALYNGLKLLKEKESAAGDEEKVETKPTLEATKTIDLSNELLSLPKPALAAVSSIALSKLAGRKLDKASWQEKQSKAYSRWANRYLVAEDLEITNLFDDLNTGVVLCKLLELITEEKVGRFKLNPRIRIQRLEILNLAITFIKDKGIKLVNIGAEDIEEKNQTIVLALMWALILRFQIAHVLMNHGNIVIASSASNSTLFAAGEDEKKVDEETIAEKKEEDLIIKEENIDMVEAKQLLLLWVNNQIKPYDLQVSNFTKNWTDGRVLCALCDSMDQGCLPMTSLSGDALQDVQRALEVANEELEIPIMVDAEDIVNQPDSKSMMMYISLFREYANYHEDDEDGEDEEEEKRQAEAEAKAKARAEEEAKAKAEEQERQRQELEAALIRAKQEEEATRAAEEELRRREEARLKAKRDAEDAAQRAERERLEEEEKERERQRILEAKRKQEEEDARELARLEAEKAEVLRKFEEAELLKAKQEEEEKKRKAEEAANNKRLLELDLKERKGPISNGNGSYTMPDGRKLICPNGCIDNGVLKFSAWLENNMIKVHVHEARVLKAMDLNGFSDPYVKIYLLPDEDKGSKQKTKIKKKTLQPLWNEDFEYPIDVEKLGDRMLAVAVWDYDGWASNDFIGQIVIDLDQVPAFDGPDEARCNDLYNWYALQPKESEVPPSGSVKVKHVFKYPDGSSQLPNGSFILRDGSVKEPIAHHHSKGHSRFANLPRGGSYLDDNCILMHDGCVILPSGAITRGDGNLKLTDHTIQKPLWPFPSRPLPHGAKQLEDFSFEMNGDKVVEPPNSNTCLRLGAMEISFTYFAPKRRLIAHVHQSRGLRPTSASGLRTNPQVRVNFEDTVFVDQAALKMRMKKRIIRVSIAEDCGGGSIACQVSFDTKCNELSLTVLEKLRVKRALVSDSEGQKIENTGCILVLPPAKVNFRENWDSVVDNPDYYLQPNRSVMDYWKLDKINSSYEFTLLLHLIPQQEMIKKLASQNQKQLQKPAEQANIMYLSKPHRHVICQLSTAVHKNTCNPEFDHKFTFNRVSQKDLKDKHINLEVWGDKQFLGRVTLEASQAKQKSIPTWHAIQSRSVDEVAKHTKSVTSNKEAAKLAVTSTLDAQTHKKKSWFGRKRGGSSAPKPAAPPKQQHLKNMHDKHQSVADIKKCTQEIRRKGGTLGDLGEEEEDSEDDLHMADDTANEEPKTVQIKF